MNALFINPQLPIDSFGPTFQQVHSSNDIFLERGLYLNCLRLFFAYFQQVPNCKTLHRIDYQKAIAWFELAYTAEIIKVHGREAYFPNRKRMQFVDVIYILKNGILVNLEKDSVYLVFPYGKEEEAQAILLQFKKFLRRRTKTREISLVVNGRMGLTTSAVKIKKPKIDLLTHYNDDLPTIHRKIVKSLKDPQQSGLILLHGSPGTGKSTYIRYLIYQQSKPVIFLPPGLAMQMDSPGFMDFLTENKHSIFVIEDAEELLVARGSERHASISMLLNLTDGLLGECLGIQVIATFNTALSKIDTALLRKGRLQALYEFKPLPQKKAAALVDSLGFSSEMVETDMTLADIFHMDEKLPQYGQRDSPIGFQFR